MHKFNIIVGLLSSSLLIGCQTTGSSSVGSTASNTGGSGQTQSSEVAAASVSGDQSNTTDPAYDPDDARTWSKAQVDAWMIARGWNPGRPFKSSDNRLPGGVYHGATYVDQSDFQRKGGGMLRDCANCGVSGAWPNGLAKVGKDGYATRPN